MSKLNYNQRELNFYGFNPNNIIQRDRKGWVTCTMKYDGENKLYVVRRETKRSVWEDRYKEYDKALKRYYDFLSKTNKELEKMLFIKR